MQPPGAGLGVYSLGLVEREELFRWSRPGSKPPQIKRFHARMAPLGFGAEFRGVVVEGDKLLIGRDRGGGEGEGGAPAKESASAPSIRLQTFLWGRFYQV